MSAPEVVALLNELVTGFDEMTEKYGMSAIAALSSAMVSIALSVILVEVGKFKDYALNRCIEAEKPFNLFAQKRQTNKQRSFYGHHNRRAITLTRTYGADFGTGTLLPEAEGTSIGTGYDASPQSAPRKSTPARFHQRHFAGN
jgi:hypothetical protein